MLSGATALEKGLFIGGTAGFKEMDKMPLSQLTRTRGVPSVSQALFL